MTDLAMRNAPYPVATLATRNGPLDVPCEPVGDYLAITPGITESTSGKWSLNAYFTITHTPTGATAGPVTTRVTAADIVGAAVEHVSAPAALAHVPPTVEAIDADEALSRIRHAADQDTLDRIKQLCRAAGLRDQAVLAAWTRRAEELAAPVVEPDEVWPEQAQLGDQG